MTTDQQKAKAKAIFEVIQTLLDLIKSCPDGVPSGHLYASLMGTISLDTYNFLIKLLEAGGKVTIVNHYIKAVPCE